MRQVLDWGMSRIYSKCFFSVMFYRKHKYETKGPEEEVESLSQGSGLSQGSALSQGSGMSQASGMSTDADSTDGGTLLNCRICKEAIPVDNVKEYTACTKPSGSAHFVSHYVCLGLYPTTRSERGVIKTTTRCPKHYSHSYY